MIWFTFHSAPPCISTELWLLVLQLPHKQSKAPCQSISLGLHLQNLRKLQSHAGVHLHGIKNKSSGTRVNFKLVFFYGYSLEIYKGNTVWYFLVLKYALIRYLTKYGGKEQLVAYVLGRNLITSIYILNNPKVHISSDNKIWYIIIIGH